MAWSEDAGRERTKAWMQASDKATVLDCMGGDGEGNCASLQASVPTLHSRRILPQPRYSGSTASSIAGRHRFAGRQYGLRIRPQDHPWACAEGRRLGKLGRGGLALTSQRKHRLHAIAPHQWSRPAPPRPQPQPRPQFLAERCGPTAGQHRRRRPTAWLGI
jgi:hypothetical protein